jgi:hypothetical protein
MRTEAALAPAVNVRIEIVDLVTGAIRQHQVHNRVTLGGRNRIRDALAGDAVSLTVTDVAMGTGTTAPADGDVDLVGEVYRDVPTQIIRSAGKVTFKLYVPSTAANGHTIGEAGLWIGALLLARVTWPPEDKTTAQAWTIVWDVPLNAG